MRGAHRTPSARGLAWLLGFALGSGPLVVRADGGPSARDETGLRAFLGGTEPGSLRSPRLLDSEAALRDLCRELADPERIETAGDAFERGRQRYELREKGRGAAAQVYAIVIPPRAFSVEDYRYEKRALALVLERALVALDSAAVIRVMDRKGVFHLSHEEASGIAKRIEAGALSLRIAFQLDHAAEAPSACFSYPRSATYALRVRPLAYELVEDGVTIARTRTPRMARLMAWLDPGASTVRLSASGAGDDAGEIGAALEVKRAEIEACVEPVSLSRDRTLTVVFSGTVTREGKLAEVTRVLEAIEEAAVLDCLEEVVTTVAPPRGLRGRTVELTIAVEREEGSASPPQP